MKKLVFLTCLLVSLACEKAPEAPGCSIKYEVIAESSSPVEYSINYLFSDGSEFEVGSFTSAAWVSNPVPGFEPGDLVRVTVMNQASPTTFTLRIKKNGILLDQITQTVSSGSLSLEQYIPVI